MTHWRAMGEHLGYPPCCVAEFVRLIEQGRMPGQIAGRGPWSGTGFIPCSTHRAQIRNHEVTVESLIANRRAKRPFPEFSIAESDAFIRGMTIA